MEQIVLHSITPEEFYSKIRAMLKEVIKEERNQDQLLTKEGALKVAGISNALFLRAIEKGLVKPQIVKDRRKAMYLESEVVLLDKAKLRR